MLAINAKYIKPKTKIKRFWAGTYGGHYSAIVFFKKKPTHLEEYPHSENAKTDIDLLRESAAGNIAGCMDFAQFREMFMADQEIPVLSIAVKKDELFQITISDFPESLLGSNDFDFDGWQSPNFRNINR